MSPSAYCKNSIDLDALKNRCWPIYLHVPIYEEEPHIPPDHSYLIRPRFAINAELLLALYVKYFPNIFQLPPPDTTIAIQDQTVNFAEVLGSVFKDK